jgi:hypothetical protein
MMRAFNLPLRASSSQRLNLACVLPFGARRDFPVFERSEPFDPLMVEPEERYGPHVTKLKRKVFRGTWRSESWQRNDVEG